MICRALLMQLMDCAFCFDLARAGKSMLAKIAMIAITTSSSINVKADGDGVVVRAAAKFGNLNFAFKAARSVNELGVTAQASREWNRRQAICLPLTVIVSSPTLRS